MLIYKKTRLARIWLTAIIVTKIVIKVYDDIFDLNKNNISDRTKNTEMCKRKENS